MHEESKDEIDTTMFIVTFNLASVLIILQVDKIVLIKYHRIKKIIVCIDIQLRSVTKDITYL